LRASRPLTGDSRDYDTLIDRIGEAQFALLGEASHGTHEFYRERAEITKRLIEEKGFAGVAVEADWPDACRVNGYVRGVSDDVDAIEALSDFRSFRHGCGATKRLSSLSNGCARTTMSSAGPEKGRVLRPRSLQPARLDESGAAISGKG
jgi:erythromycin esterase-like protein